MTVLAWHFLSADRRLGYGDGRLVKKGQTLRVEGEPALCWNGLHGSRRLIDALSNALGPIIERVEIGADKPYEIVAVENKLVGTWRKTLWWIDATMVLHEFACREAEEALRDVGITDERYWDAIRIKRLWVQGKATDEELAEAQFAAEDYDTARAAARTAAADAAYSTARFAARGAAGARAVADIKSVAAARESEEVVAWATPAGIARITADIAAWIAAANTARARQNRRLTAMVCAAHRLQP